MRGSFSNVVSPHGTEEDCFCLWLSVCDKRRSTFLKWHGYHSSIITNWIETDSVCVGLFCSGPHSTQPNRIANDSISAYFYKFTLSVLLISLPLLPRLPTFSHLSDFHHSPLSFFILRLFRTLPDNYCSAPFKCSIQVINVPHSPALIY